MERYLRCLQILSIVSRLNLFKLFNFEERCCERRISNLNNSPRHFCRNVWIAFCRHFKIQLDSIRNSNFERRCWPSSVERRPCCRGDRGFFERETRQLLDHFHWKIYFVSKLCWILFRLLDCLFRLSLLVVSLYRPFRLFRTPLGGQRILSRSPREACISSSRALAELEFSIRFSTIFSIRFSTTFWTRLSIRPSIRSSQSVPRCGSIQRGS